MPDRAIIIGITAVSVIIVLAYLTIPQTASNGATTDSDTRLLPIVTPFNDKTCTYVIYQDLPIVNNNYTYYANNCASGAVLSSSMNASKVFNDVATNCNINKGCFVHIKGYSNSNAYRAYNITKAIQIPESGHFNLAGEGTEFTVLRIPTTYDNNMFEYAGNHNSKVSFFNSFSSFEMIGNLGTGSSNNRGFYINTTSGDFSDSVFYNLFLREFKQDDMYFGSLVSGVNNNWNNKLDDMTIELAGRAGLYATGGINCQDMKVTESKFLYNTQFGVYNDCYYNTFLEGWYYKNNQTAFKNNGGVSNIITNNRFFDSGGQTTNTYYDLWNLGNGNNISQNSFLGSDQTNRAKYAFLEDTFTHDNVITSNRFKTGSTNYVTSTFNIGSTSQDDNLFTNNVGANPINKVSSPFFTPNAGSTVIPTNGNATIPKNNTVFTNVNTPMYMTVTGGNNVSIELQDGAGNVIQTGLTTITEQVFPFGYKGKITWHSSAPTITVWFQ